MVVVAGQRVLQELQRRRQVQRVVSPAAIAEVEGTGHLADEDDVPRVQVGVDETVRAVVRRKAADLDAQASSDFRDELVQGFRHMHRRVPVSARPPIKVCP